MATLTNEQILEEIDSRTVADLCCLIKAIEDRFGVKVPQTGPPVVVKQPIEVAEEQTEFTLVLKSSGDKKIQVIKVLRAITGLGLKESKDLSEKVPGVIKEGLSKAEAAVLKKELEDNGAVIEIK
jgi:large subunit ribosomal protein L7/L12